MTKVTAGKERVNVPKWTSSNIWRNMVSSSESITTVRIQQQNFDMIMNMIMNGQFYKKNIGK